VGFEYYRDELLAESEDLDEHEDEHDGDAEGAERLDDEDDRGLPA
jgi:hypothetical protein